MEIIEDSSRGWINERVDTKENRLWVKIRIILMMI